jgi:hypothetical protein
MFKKMSDVFQKKRFGFFCFDNFGYMKKQIASTIFKSFLKSRLAERLTRKTARYNIEIGDVFRLHFRYITREISAFKHLGRIIVEIRQISFPGGLIPLGSENAFGSRVMESEMKTSYTREQIYKSERILFFCLFIGHGRKILFNY